MADIWEDVLKLRAERDDLQAQVYAAGDVIMDMREAYDVAVTQNLEEQTWLRMRAVAAESDEAEFWRAESLKWAQAFGTQRQLTERQIKRINAASRRADLWTFIALLNFAGLLVAVVHIWLR